MGKAVKIASVCKSCGAVGKAKAQHCVCCGSAITEDMLLYKRKPIEKEGSLGKSTQEGTKKRSFSGTAALAFSVVATLALAVKMGTGVFASLLAIVFAVVSLSKKKNRVLPAAVGLGLGVYSLFFFLLWFFHPLLYLF